MVFDLHFAKPRFKFSSSHFTIFSATNAERLHGHNYQVEVTLSFRETEADTGLAVDFNAVKPLIEKLCDQLDEKILLPKNSPFLKLKEQGTQITVDFGENENLKHYEFPIADCVLLPMVNTSSETLAEWLANQLKASLSLKANPHQVQVKVSETHGQAVTYTLGL